MPGVPPRPTENTDARPELGSPLLQLPVELRLMIFERYFDGIFEQCGIVSDHEAKLNNIVITERSARRAKPVTSILLVNRQMHDEAEDTLWKNARLTLDVKGHYKNGYTPSLLHLSHYAYSNLRYLSVVLYVDRRYRFNLINSEYICLGGEFREKRTTWRFTERVRRFTNLKHATFRVIEIHPGIPIVYTKYKRQVIDAILSILRSTPAEDITVVAVIDDDEVFKALLRDVKNRLTQQAESAKFKYGVELPMLWKMANLIREKQRV